MANESKFMEIAPILWEVINVINLILEPLLDDSFSKIKFLIDIPTLFD
jgi:hypothetical protein